MVAGTLVGVKWKGKWTAEPLIISGWIFLFGVPVGVLVAGSYFSLGVWLATVLMVLMIVNIDDALLQMSNYATYGVDGEVETYEEVN